MGPYSNSQGREQLNRQVFFITFTYLDICISINLNFSVLDKCVSSLHQMGYRSYMNFVRVFLALTNLKKV